MIECKAVGSRTAGATMAVPDFGKKMLNFRIYILVNVMLKIPLETLGASCDQVIGDTKSVRLSEIFRQLSNPMLGIF